MHAYSLLDSVFNVCSFFLFYTYIVIIFFFFFSSRRRHTRSDRDWSSDVCSSDLAPPHPCRGSSARRGSASARCCARRAETLRLRCRRGDGRRLACPSGCPFRPLIAGMAVKRAGRRELAELVADHVLGHQHRDEFMAVIDAKRQADEL